MIRGELEGRREGGGRKGGRGAEDEELSGRYRTQKNDHIKNMIYKEKKRKEEGSIASFSLSFYLSYSYKVSLSLSFASNLNRFLYQLLT